MSNSVYSIEIRLNNNEIAKIPQYRSTSDQVKDRAVAKLKYLREQFPSMDWMVRVSYLENGKWEQRLLTGRDVADLLEVQNSSSRKE